MMNNITVLNWNDIELCCVELYNKVKQYNIDVIVSIQRGGCVPGVIMSHLLGVSEFYAIGIRTTSSEDIKAKRLDTPIVSIPNTLVNTENKNVLIIDDVTNTGKTFMYAKEEISKYKPQTCLTAALIWDGDNSSECVADFYAKYSPSWVVFPWETINVSSD